MSEMADKLLDRAEIHIQKAGYNGFSFRDLAAEIGIKSASVHHHFPTKAGMAVAVARRYTDRFLAAVEQSREADPVSTYRAAFRNALARDNRICLCGVLGAEAGGLPPAVADEARAFFRRCVDDLSERIGGKEANARSLHVLSTLEGAMILARIFDDVGVFDRATATLTPL